MNPTEPINDVSAKIREAFGYIDRENTGSILREEVGTILRYLGIFPSERAIVQEILPQMQGDELSTVVTLDRLEPVVLQLLSSKTWKPESNQVLAQAWQMISDYCGSESNIEAISKLLTEEGEGFRQQEIDEFLTIAAGVNTSTTASTSICMEDYIFRFNNQIHQSTL